MESLDDLGSRMGLSEEDINQLKRKRTKWKIIFWISGILVVIGSFIIGFLIGRALNDSGSSGGSYPYLAPAFTLLNGPERRISRWQFPLLACLGFLTGLSQPVFGDRAIEYGVFYRKGGMN